MLLFKDIHYDARVKREAAALAQAGHEVVIACLAEYSEPPPEVAEGVTLWRYAISTKRIKRRVVPGETKSAGLTAGTSGERGQLPLLSRLVLSLVRFPALKLFKDVAASLEFYRYVARDLERHRVDVIHSHDLNTLPAGVSLSRRFKTKLVYDSHELFNEMAGKNWLERRVGYAVERALINRIDHLIVVNAFVHKLFTKRYGPRPTTVVQNVPDAPDFSQTPPPDVLDLRRHFGLGADDVLLLYQGGLNPERGLEECVQAVAMLPESLKLVLIGEGRLREHLEQLVKELNLSTRVFFLGQVPSERLLWYTRQADVGLVVYKNTSLNNYYSTPNKIFEYLLAGIPTVASDHPGKRIVVEEGTGVCVEETPEAIRDGILDVLARLEEYKQACQKKRERFSWPQEQKKLIRAYRQLEAVDDEQAAYH